MTAVLNIKIELPLVSVFKFEIYAIKTFTECISELLNLNNKMIVDILDLGYFNVKINYLENHIHTLQIIPILEDAISFEINVPNNYNNIEIKSEKLLSETEKVSIFESVIVNLFKAEIWKLLILSQIAKPGSIKLREGRIYINSRFYGGFPAFSSVHRESIDDILSLKWIKYYSLNISDIYKWFDENNFSFKRHSASSIERALNAFTHLFGGRSSGLIFDLLWSLVGIESLYCSGKEGLSEQIFNKTQIYLGPMTDFKKRIKQMYDFRSRLVHGDMNIPPYYYNNTDSEHDLYSDKLYDSSVLAVSILTITLQKMIVENKNKLIFKTIVE